MRLLVVDDSPEVVESVQLNFMLMWPEAELVATSDGRRALDLLQEEPFDLVLLDIGLPDGNGFSVLEQIRTTSQVPVVMLTARDGVEEKVRGLRLGADDYVTKPFNHVELIERVRAVLRRTTVASEQASSIRLYELELDVARQEVRLGDQVIQLTPTEYRLLRHLAQHQGVTQSHEALLKEVWGPEYEDELEYLRVYIRRLRDKLGDDPEAPRYLMTVRGYGYRFGPPA